MGIKLLFPPAILVLIIVTVILMTVMNHGNEFLTA